MESPQELDIKKYLQLLYKKRYLFIFSAMAVITITIIVSYLLPKEYEATSTIFIERNFMNDLIKGVTIAQSFEERTKALSTVMKSRSFLLRVLKDLNIDVAKYNEEQREGLVAHLQQKTEIKVELSREKTKNMDLFSVSYRGNDPKMTADFVNGLVNRYIQENISTSKEETFGATRFLSDQLSLFKGKLDRTEADIERLSKAKDVLFDERLSNLEKKLSEMLVLYTDSHPDVVKVKTEIELLREHLKHKQPGVAYAAAEGNEIAGVAAGPETGSGRKTLAALERERDSLKKIYEELLATKSKSEVSSQIEVQDKSGAFRILDPAIRPLTPVKPKRMNILILGVFGGLALGLGIIILVDSLDTSIKSLATVKALGLPVIAVIPAIQNKKELAKKKRKDTFVYSIAGIYAIAVVGIIAVEFMGLPYVDNFSRTAMHEIKGTIDGIFYHPGVRRPRP